MLFLHGFMGGGEDWREVSAGLDDGFFRVAVDLPGHGASLGMPPDRYTMEGAARYANAINFYKNVAIIGGFLLLYVTGPGRYSVDARLDRSDAPPPR